MFGKNVVLKLTGNATFPSPDVLPATITTACGTLDGLIALAVKGSKQSHDNVKAQVTVLKGLLDQDAAYVEKIANGDVAKIESAGYEGTSGSKTKKPLPEQVIIKKSGSNEQGTISIDFNSVKNAVGIIAIAAKPGVVPAINYNYDTLLMGNIQPDSAITFTFGTGHHIDIKGLQSDVRYEVILFGFNASGKGLNSNMLSIVVQ
ncbi:MAG: hypothetical protein RJA07_2819 [Bacteroidota bacterium]|jgi:hypothetical protein